MTMRRLTSVDRSTIAIPLVWLLALLAVPLISVALLSVHVVADAIPPIAPLIGDVDGHLTVHASTRAYHMLGADILYRSAFLSALVNAAFTMIGCVLIGFPIALAIAQAPPKRRNWYVFLAVLPFWTSFLLRAYAWIGLIRDSGPINSALLSLGLIHDPISMLFTPGAVLLVMVYSYLPFFVLPMYAVLESLPAELLAAAADLGARPAYAFRTVTLPLALPGLISGAVLVFIPAVGEYVIPELVGNSSTIMIGGILWDEFFQNRDWPLAAAIAIVTFLLLIIPSYVVRWWLGPLGAENK
jgi:putrescine transport system permease protein